jgi:chromosome segregation ATPase
MKYIVTGGTHSRVESGRSVTYKTGDTIELDAKEAGAFPGKFTPAIVPRTEADESREAALEAKVQTLEGQVTTLTAERDELKKPPGAGEVTKLKGDLAKAQGEATRLKADLSKAQGEATQLKADNETLSQQLEEALKPPKEPELKTNPAESTKTAKGTAKSE